MKRLLGIVALLCAALGALPARAHDPQLSSLTLRLESGGLRATAIAPRAGLAPGPAGAQLASRVRLRTGDRRVPLRPGRAVENAEQGTIILDLRAPGPLQADPLLVESRLFPEAPQSRTLVFVYRDGQLTQQEVLTARRPAFVLSRASDRPALWPTAGRFVAEGIHHIALGPDHILFLLGLLLLGGSLSRLLKIVTAFTAAHSLTLALAALGKAAPPSSFVEPFIALSIVSVAVDNLLTRRGEGDWRALAAFGFGLVHGFGFAGALQEIGLPRALLGVSLASFNVGVELGQAALVLTVAPLLALLAHRSPAAADRARIAGSVALGLIGTLWFLERTFGTL